MKRALIISVIAFVIGAAAGMLLSRHCLAPDREKTTQTDTLYLRDTNIYNFPDMVSEVVVANETVVIEDSLIIVEDSLCALPMQQRHYKGEDYEAWVSGYRPRLDSLWTFPQTRYITKTIFVDSRKCNTVALETAASWCGSASLTLSLEYTREWKRIYIGGSAGYDLIAKTPYIGINAGIPIYSW